MLLKQSHCPACGSNNNLQSLYSIPYTDPVFLEHLLERYEGNVEKQDLADGKYELVHCVCGHLFQLYVPDEELSEKIYTYPESRVAESMRKITQAPLQKTINIARTVQIMGVLIGGEPDKRVVLDFGAGWGSFLSMAKQYCYQVEGVEISRERMAFVNASGISCVSDVKNLKHPLFDYIHVDQVFEHLSEPFSVLQKLVNRLAPGGILYISVPDCRLALKDSMAGRVNLFRKSVHPLEHVQGFTHRSLLRMAKRAGLKPLGRLSVARTLFKKTGIWSNAHLLQAGVEYWYRYPTSTSLYFIKKNE